MDEDSAFREWQKAHPDLVHFLTIQVPLRGLKRQSDINLFMKKRAGVHRRYFERLNELSLRLAEDVGEIFEAVSKLRQMHVSNATEHVFDEQKNNMLLRKAHFATTKIISMTEKFFMARSQQFKKKLEMVSKVTQLFEGNVIPSGCIVTVTESFFSAPKDDKMAAQRIEQMKLYRQHVTEVLRDPQRQPIWKRVGYTRFFDDLVRQGMEAMDDLSYFLPLEGEVWLSRALFGLKSKQGQKIDAEIAKWAQNGFSDMNREIGPFLQALLKEHMKGTLGRAQESAGLMLYYRAVSDRLFETHPELFTMTDKYATLRMKHRNRSLDTLNIPESMKPARVAETASECFLADDSYRKAIDIANQCYFLVPPVDVLYKLDRAMLLACDVARSRLTGASCDEPGEAPDILSWDDSFSLFSEVILASDIPDMLQLRETATLMVPYKDVDVFLDAQKNNIEAFILYFCGSSDQEQPEAA